MSFSVDQFMQVKCKLVLTTDTDSESIQPDNEKVRLCTSYSDKNATLIIMICSNHISNNNILTYYLEKRANRATKARIKQIFYHQYNEDIVAMSLSENGNMLALISSSSTIYILPIRNILLKSSHSKSMYFYDAFILNCCTIDNPKAIVYWQSQSIAQSAVIVANEQGRISFINVDDKREFNLTNIGEPIIQMELMRDMFSYSLLITSDTLNQYRFALEMIECPENQKMNFTDEYIYLEKDVLSSWDRKPIPIKLQSNAVGPGGGGGGKAAAAALHRVLVPSGRVRSHNSLFSGRERSVPLLFYHQTVGMISVVDILGAQRPKVGSNSNGGIQEPRLLRFFSSKQFYYRPQKPTLLAKINALDANEKITHLLLTDRFLVIATDANRCLIFSRNCCSSKNLNPNIELDPLVKEITFGKDEQIQLVLKSPLTNDQDGIIDSFLLTTSKCIYSIEARQSCRDMFINLIDSHLGIKPPRARKNATENLISRTYNPHEYILVDDYRSQRKYSESNLMISNFLGHQDEVYERINYDSRAFSILFKLELNSLYEAYGDKLMLRNQFDLANRFFQMAKFNHIKTLGKYVRLGAYKETVEYVKNLLGDENEILDEKERIDLAKVAFECLLAKTIIERSKMALYSNKLDRKKLKILCDHAKKKEASSRNSPMKRYDLNISRRLSQTSLNKIDLYKLCEHSPRGHAAKLSGNTIIDETNDDEATMTNCLNEVQNTNRRLECEKALIGFVKKLMPSSLYSYVMTQLVDFCLFDLADNMARADASVHTLTRIILKSKEEKRAIFRDGRHEQLNEKLTLCDHNELTRIDNSEPKFLEFITSLEVTKALVKDINLTSEYLGYQKTPVQFRKYSYTALRQLESFRKFAICQKKSTNDDCADLENISSKIFTKQQQKSIENIFLIFLMASLDESTEDSCKLWFNYINFYLNYVGTVDELEVDILNLLDSSSIDCRFAITLYKAIGRDEAGSSKPFISEGTVGTPLESMEKLYNLSEIFENEFLVRVLEKTLDLVPKSWYQVHNFSHMLVL